MRKTRNLFYSTLMVQTPVYCSNLSLHLQLLLLFSCHLGLHYILSLLILLQQHKLFKQCYLSVKTNNLIKTLPFSLFFVYNSQHNLKNFALLLYLFTSGRHSSSQYPAWTCHVLTTAAQHRNSIATPQFSLEAGLDHKSIY